MAKGRKTGGRTKGTPNINKDTPLKGVYTDLIGSFKSGRYYVYYHINPTTKEIFYIGKGNGNRAWSTGRNKFWNDYVYELAKYDVKIICANMSDEEALSIESVLIKIHQPVCNINYTKLKLVNAI